jgi:hypothetical protein
MILIHDSDSLIKSFEESKIPSLKLVYESLYELNIKLKEFVI